MVAEETQCRRFMRPSLVRCRALYVIDDDHIHRAAARLKLQAKLLLECFEHREAVENRWERFTWLRRRRLEGSGDELHVDFVATR